MMRMHPGRALVSFLAGITIMALAQGAQATLLDPADSGFSLLGALPGGDLTIDTGTSGDSGSTPMLTYGGGTLAGNIVTQAGGPDIAVFLFDGGSTLASGNMLTVTSGSRPLALLFNGGATLSGTIDVSGNDASFTSAAAAIGVAGGGNGGQGGWATATDGEGLGGGSVGSPPGSLSGGGGGGFGTNGGNAGSYAPGGLAYGDPLSGILQGGSGGGGGGSQRPPTYNGGAVGGAGGGTVEIGALTFLNLDGASILANGGDGATANPSISSLSAASGGGGSGGGILLHAFDIALDSASLLQASGGAGGGGATGGACGGAGRIEVLTNVQGSFSNAGTVEAMGGSDACNDGLLLATSLETIGVAYDNGGGGTTPPPTTSVPEPGGLGLLGFVFAGVMLRRRRA